MRRLIPSSVLFFAALIACLLLSDSNLSENKKRPSDPSKGKPTKPLVSEKDGKDQTTSSEYETGELVVRQPTPTQPENSEEPGKRIFPDFKTWSQTPEFRQVKNIVPPINGVLPPSKATLVTPEVIEKGGIVNLGFNAFLHLPKDALVDEAGNPVNEPVKISYCPLSDPVDVYLSGVPMSYDSAGAGYTFRTAGMVRLEATTHSGKQVQLKKGTQMQLDMPTVDTADTYNFYTFNEEDGKWDYAQPAPPARPVADIIIDSLKVDYTFDITPFAKKFKNLTYHHLIGKNTKKEKYWSKRGFVAYGAENRMRKALYGASYKNTNLLRLNASSVIVSYTRDNKPVRELRFTVQETNGNDFFPELRNFRGLYFAAEDCKNLQDFYKAYRRGKRFHDIRVQYTPGDDHCILELKDEKDFVYIKARVSGSSGKGFDIRALRFSHAFQRYQRDLRRKERLHDKVIQERKREFLNNMQRFGLAIRTANGNYRQVSLPGFASYNCDQIARMEAPVALNMRFYTEDTVRLRPTLVVICDTKVKATFTFWPGTTVSHSSGGFGFAIITANDRSYYLTSAGRNRPKQYLDKETYFLKEFPEIESAEELRSLLMSGS